MGIVFDPLQVKDADLARVQLAVAQAFLQVPTVPAPNIVTVTSDYKVNGTEDALHVNAQAGPIKITMQAPNASNKPLIVKQVNLASPAAKVNMVTLASADGSKTIAGQSMFELDMSGVASVEITADNLQHWPAVSGGGNPPVAAPGGLVYTGIPPIYVSGTVISFRGGPTPPPVVPIVPWFAPVPYGNQNTFISNSTGAEGWAAECMVDFTAAPSGVSMYLWLEAQDTASAGVVRVRIGGGTYKDITAPVFAAVNVSSATMAALIPIATPITTPSGLQRVTLTLQSTNTNKTTATGVNLQFR